MGDGSQWGIKIKYLTQEKPEGIGQAYIIAEQFLQKQKSLMILGDNFLYGEGLTKILEHLDIINKDIISIFNKNNIKPIECLNKKLDPNFHQAMMEIEDDQKEPGTIIQEIQKGFTIKDRLLRPSLVGVSKKTQNIEEENQENIENIENK